MVFRSPFKSILKAFKDGAILAESGREFQSFGAEQNDPSHNEVLFRGTVKLLVSDDLNVL